MIGCAPVIPRNRVTRNLGDCDERFLAALGMTGQEAGGWPIFNKELDKAEHMCQNNRGSKTEVTLPTARCFWRFFAVAAQPGAGLNKNGMVQNPGKLD